MADEIQKHLVDLFSDAIETKLRKMVDERKKTFLQYYSKITPPQEIDIRYWAAKDYLNEMAGILALIHEQTPDETIKTTIIQFFKKKT